MIRLVLLIVLFLLSLLAVFKAPAYYLWLLAIGVTEFPWVFILITLGILSSGFWVTKYQLQGSIIGAIALVLFITPIVRASIVANTLSKGMIKSLGQSNLGTYDKPFTFWEMFSFKAQVTDTTLTYVKYPDVSLNLDFYQRVNDDAWPRPCVIVVHGGSWSSGDSRQLPELNSYLALHGYNVASINYRMAPKYQTPAPVEDISNAMKYLTAHAEELHIDARQFILLGRSAGAQIALLAAYTLHDARIKGVIDFYGPADMVWGYSIPSNPLIMDSRKVMRDYIGGSYEQVPEKFKACSPLEFVDKTSVPTLIIHGENDVLVSPEHSRRLNLKLQQNNIPHYYLKLPWATHGFDFNLNGPGGQLSTYAVETFLNTITK